MAELMNGAGAGWPSGLASPQTSTARAAPSSVFGNT